MQTMFANDDSKISARHSNALSFHADNGCQSSLQIMCLRADAQSRAAVTCAKEDTNATATLDALYSGANVLAFALCNGLHHIGTRTPNTGKNSMARAMSASLSDVGCPACANVSGSSPVHWNLPRGNPWRGSECHRPAGRWIHPVC